MRAWPHTGAEALKLAINMDKYLGHFYGSTNPVAQQLPECRVYVLGGLWP